MLLFVLSFLFSCLEAAYADVDCTKGPPAVSSETPVPNLGKLKLRLIFYKKCGEYDAAARQVFGQARAFVQERSPQVRHPAVVLDIDETSLDNWEEIKQDDFGFIALGDCSLLQDTPCGSHAWELRARARAIAPALAFYQAIAGKVAVFFITGRRDDPVERCATETNLINVGYDGWTGLVLRPAQSQGQVADYKSAERAKIEARGYHIVATIGDQESDLAGGHADRGFKVPNPFYFIP